MLRAFFALALIMAAPAAAQEPEIGFGVACDTADQITEFIQILDGTPQQALDAVNAKYPETACAPIEMAYIRGETVRQVRGRDGGLFEVVSAIVLAVRLNGQVIPAHPPIIQFILFQVKETSA